MKWQQTAIEGGGDDNVDLKEFDGDVKAERQIVTGGFTIERERDDINGLCDFGTFKSKCSFDFYKLKLDPNSNNMLSYL